MENEWRAVVGCEGWYEVSNYGEVRRIKPGKATKPGRLLKPTRRKNGRMSVYLRHEGDDIQREMHHIVAAAFLGPKPEGKEINHLDGNPANNRADNLEYCTHRENMQHAYRLGLVRLGIGEDQHLAKLTTEQIIVIRNCTAPAKLIARVFDVSPITIRNIQKRRTWKHVS